MYMVLLKWPSHIFCVFVCVCALKKYYQFYWRLFWRKMRISVIFLLHCGSLNDTREIGDRWAGPKEHTEVSYFLDRSLLIAFLVLFKYSKSKVGVQVSRKMHTFCKGEGRQLQRLRKDTLPSWRAGSRSSERAEIPANHVAGRSRRAGSPQSFTTPQPERPWPTNHRGNSTGWAWTMPQRPEKWATPASHQKNQQNDLKLKDSDT